MSRRLTRIQTGTGDDGSTGLADGSRQPKDANRIVAIGEVDELNCTLGTLVAANNVPRMNAPLTTLQHWLFDLGGELAVPGSHVLDAQRVRQVEDLIERLNGELPALDEFVLPGGNMAAACCHQARAICRRTERNLVALNRETPLNTHSLVFINRLSDLLFVMARHMARADGELEPQWRPAQSLANEES